MSAYEPKHHSVLHAHDAGAGSLEFEQNAHVCAKCVWPKIEKCVCACVRAAENPSQLTLCGKSSLPSSSSALASITQVLVIREKAKTRRPQCRAVVASCLGEIINIQVIKRFCPVN